MNALALAVLLAQPPTGDVTDVTVIRTLDKYPGASRIWEPYLAVWGERHLIAAFGVQLAGKVDMGSLYASISTDDGKTWQEPVTVFDHRVPVGGVQWAYANAVLFRPPGQRVCWLFAMRCPLTRRHSEDAQLAAAYTADGGRSWTPVELSMHYSGPLIVVAGIHTIQRNGQTVYLFPAHRNTRRDDHRGTRDQFVLESTSLLEWRRPGPEARPKPGEPEWGFVPQPTAGDKVFLHEGNIADWDKPGELKMVMRTSSYDPEGQPLNPPRAYSTVSGDGGRTWSPAAPEPDLFNGVAKAYFGNLPGGGHIYVYNDGPGRERKSLRYKVRPPGGAWSAERTFYDSGTKNSYPTLVPAGKNTFYAVWDSGTPTQDRTAIRFGKLTVR